MSSKSPDPLFSASANQKAIRRATHHDPPMGAVDPRPAFCITLLPLTPRHGPAFPPPEHHAHEGGHIVPAVGPLRCKEASQDKRWVTAINCHGADNNLFCMIINRERPLKNTKHARRKPALPYTGMGAQKLPSFCSNNYVTVYT